MKHISASANESTTTPTTNSPKVTTDYKDNNIDISNRHKEKKLLKTKAKVKVSLYIGSNSMPHRDTLDSFIYIHFGVIF